MMVLTAQVLEAHHHELASCFPHSIPGLLDCMQQVGDTLLSGQLCTTLPTLQPPWWLLQCLIRSSNVSLHRLLCMKQGC
jgi:hypothetical protein